MSSERKLAFLPVCMMLVLAGLLAFSRPTASIAEDGPAAPADVATDAQAQADADETTIDLSMKDAVLAAIRGNLDIKVERYSPAIKDAEVMTATGEFDPTVGATLSYEDRKSPQTSQEGLASNAGTTETERTNLNLVVEGKLETGTRYSVSFGSEESQFTQKDTPTGDKSNPSEYNLDFTIALTQPLLKDFGREPNTAAIMIARGAKSMSVEDFSSRVTEVVADAQSAYWDLLAVKRNLVVSEQSLALARDLLKENRIRLEVGAMARLEVLQAETGVAQREEEVIIARSLIEDAEDNLKRILNLPKDVEQWKVRINPTDTPDIVEREIDLEAELKLAFKNRPEYRKSLMQIENDLINERFAENQLLPTAEVTAEGKFLSVNESFSDAFEDVAKGTAPTWQVGLTTEYPLGNRAARGEREKAGLERRRSEKESENQRLSIIVEVNKAARDIRTGFKRIEVTTKSIELAEESLRAERKKLEVGVSTSHNVLRFEEDLADAQRRQILAGLEYAKGLIELARATGVLLEENDIVIDENI
jgi:outer membrane protein TolC